MKNPFAHYPAVFYQLTWIYIGSLFCLILGSVDLVIALQSMLLGIISFDPTLLFLIGALVISYVTGILFDKLQDPRRSMLIGTNLILIGFILGLFSMGSHIIIIIGFISVLVGFLLIYLACIVHVGVLFPVANDWKDNAFGFLSYLPLILGLLFGVLGFMLVDAMSLGITFFLMLKIFAIGFMYFFISRSNVGYEIIDDEEEEEAEELLLEETEITDSLTPEPNFRSTMIGLIAVYFVYSFLVTYIGQIGIYRFGSGTDNLGLDKYMVSSPYASLFLSLFIIVIYLIIGIYSFFNASSRSRQFSKINFLNFSFLILIGLEFLVPYIGSYALDTFLTTSFQFLSFLIILPIFLSVFTHLNIRENIGVWLITLMVVPSMLVMLLAYILPSGFVKYFPYLAVVLFIVFMIIFRENRKTWEERLGLNESNQEEDELDIFEHFVDE